MTQAKFKIFKEQNKNDISLFLGTGEEVITVPLHCSGGVSALDMVDVLVENKVDVNTKDLKSIKRSYINYLMYF